MRLVLVIAVAACGPRAVPVQNQPPLVGRSTEPVAPLAEPGEPLAPMGVADLGAPPSDPAVDVVAWGSTSCATLASGAVACWGNRKPVHRIAGWTDVVSLAASSELLCARHRDDRVDCGPPPDLEQFAPVEIAGTAGARELTVVNDAACIVERGGTVACWILGGPPKFERVRGISGATHVAAGHDSGPEWHYPYVSYGCALVDKGRVACFGMYREVERENDGPDGMMAKPGTKPQMRITPAAITPGLRGVTELVVQSDGLLRAKLCVRAGHGELRCGDVKHDGTIEALARREDQDDVTAWFGNCAVRGDEVSCPAMFRAPLPPVKLPAIARVAGGTQHACAITEGRVACWGANDDGQLGTSSDDVNVTPALGLVDATDLAISLSAVIAVRSNGQLVMWGRSDHDGTDVPRTFSTITDAQRVVGGDDLACALRSGGDVSCWRGIDGKPATVDALRGATDLRAADGGVLGHVGDRWVFAPAEDRQEPRELAGARAAVDVASVHHWTCAQRARPGRVECWHVGRRGGRAKTAPVAPLAFDDVARFALAPIHIPSVAIAYLAVLHPNGRVEEIELDAENGAPSSRSLGNIARDATDVTGTGVHVCATTPAGPVCRQGSIDAFQRTPVPAPLAHTTKLVMDGALCGLRADHRVICAWGDRPMLGTGTATSSAPVRVSL